MRVLFLIPKNLPPTLEGNFSKPFKDFVSSCLKKDPEDRPTAKELLKNRFFKGRGKTTMLTELIERRKRWLESNEGHSSEEDEENDQAKSPSDNGPEWEWAAPLTPAPNGLVHEDVEKSSPPRPTVAGKEKTNSPAPAGVKKKSSKTAAGGGAVQPTAASNGSGVPVATDGGEETSEKEKNCRKKTSNC